jgi:hypothetical protein
LSKRLGSPATKRTQQVQHRQRSTAINSNQQQWVWTQGKCPDAGHTTLLLKIAASGVACDKRSTSHPAINPERKPITE